MKKLRFHHLKPTPGSTKQKLRKGRGEAGKRGKTAGRGTKGTGARKTVPAYFEGGQIPLYRRIPKLRGLNNPPKMSYVVVNVSDLEEKAAEGAARGTTSNAEINDFIVLENLFITAHI
mgnify:CR=1 FL=1